MAEKKTKGKRNLVSGAKYWDFKENCIFRGTYLHDVMGKDPQDNSKEKVIGFAFADMDGEEWVITSAYAIAKALDMMLDDDMIMVKELNKPLEITWLEKIERTGKPSYNRFNVDLIE